MQGLITLFVIAAILFALRWFWLLFDRSKRGERERFIDEYQFPDSIWVKVQQRYPHLNEAD